MLQLLAHLNILYFAISRGVLESWMAVIEFGYRSICFAFQKLVKHFETLYGRHPMVPGCQRI
jgi:hypothetical protein